MLMTVITDRCWNPSLNNRVMNWENIGELWRDWFHKSICIDDYVTVDVWKTFTGRIYITHLFKRKNAVIRPMVREVRSPSRNALIWPRIYSHCQRTPTHCLFEATVLSLFYRIFCNPIRFEYYLRFFLSSFCISSSLVKWNG